MVFDDVQRLRALRDYRVLDTVPEDAFDNITRLASQIFHTPIALVSLVDEGRQWFKSRVGLDATETPREVAFCDHAIRQEEPLLVRDALNDPRFATNPLVTGVLGVRFYCGVPVRSPEGHGLGTLCLLDRVPREMTTMQVQALKGLAHQVELELEIRRRVIILEEGLGVQREQQRAKELLASMLVHDLRAPLTTVTLTASYLAQLHPESDQAFQDLLGEAERMRRMLTDVLDICLAEVHALRLRRLAFSLVPVVRKAAHRLERLAQQRGQKLVLELPDGANPIDADPDLIDRVLTNLIGNAIQHAPAEMPITIAVAERAGGGVRVEIRDLGQSIPEGSREAVFAPFEQLGDGGGRARGYGLGLAFCRMVVEAHGGTVGVMPIVPHGNAFYLELPREQAKLAAIGAEAAPKRG